MNAFQLSEEYVDATCALWPVLATFQGVPGHDGEWTDYSPEALEQTCATLRALRERVKALPPTEDFWELLAGDWLGDIIDRHLLFYGTDDALKDLNNIDSPVQHMRMVFDVMDTSKGWDDVLRRLATIDAPMRSYRAMLEHGRARGIVAARRQVEAAVEQCRVHAGEQSYFRTLLNGPGAPVERLESGVAKGCSAYAALADYLEDSYLPHACEQDGVGRERYAREALRFLGARIDLEETYGKRSAPPERPLETAVTSADKRNEFSVALPLRF